MNLGPLPYQFWAAAWWRVPALVRTAVEARPRPSSCGTVAVTSAVSDHQIRRFLYRRPRSFRSVRDLGGKRFALSTRVRAATRLFVPAAPSVAPSRCLGRSGARRFWKLGRQRGTHEARATLVAGAHGLEVGPGHRKAERPVWTTANLVGVVVVLAVVLPEANGTDLEGAALGQRHETAARAPVRAFGGRTFRIDEPLHGAHFP